MFQLKKPATTDNFLQKNRLGRDPYCASIYFRILTHTFEDNSVKLHYLLLAANLFINRIKFFLSETVSEIYFSLPTKTVHIQPLSTARSAKIIVRCFSIA